MGLKPTFSNTINYCEKVFNQRDHDIGALTGGFLRLVMDYHEYDTKSVFKEGAGMGSI